jgi:DNA-binding beta-propeller fold protein YncE
VLAFWSIGCDASVVLLRKMEELQRSFGGAIQVIAIHSPRMSTGTSLYQIADAVARLRLSIPVLHDPELETFGRYSPGGWPAAVFVDARQRVAGAVLGADPDFYSKVIMHLGAAPSRSDPAFKVGYKPPRKINRLSWPTGVAVDPSTGAIAISDYGNDRIVMGVLDPTAPRLSVTGIVGGVTGPGRLSAAGDASFVVAQPEDGSISLIDGMELSATLIGKGFVRPTGVCVDNDGSIVVADAGVDRLFRIPAESVARRSADEHLLIAGSGFTGGSDGPAARASLSQPNGVCRTPNGVVFTDAASNNVRLLTDGGTIHSVTHNNSTLHGLVDGPAHAALLSRPVDVACAPDGSLLIVDQHNNRLRRLADGEVSTLGVHGFTNPESLCMLSTGELLVADSGNHRIVVVDPARRRAQVVQIEGMERTLSLGAAPTARGNAAMSLKLSYPSPGPGPWEVTVTAQPAELLAAPLRVVRSEPGEVVIVNLGSPGKGVLTVTSTGLGEQRSIRLPLEVR